MMYLYKFRELYILLRLALGLPIIQGLADGKRVGQPSGGAGDSADVADKLRVIAAQLMASLHDIAPVVHHVLPEAAALEGHVTRTRTRTRTRTIQQQQCQHTGDTGEARGQAQHTTECGTSTGRGPRGDSRGQHSQRNNEGNH